MHTRTQQLINRNSRTFGSAVFPPALPLPEAELEREIPFTTLPAQAPENLSQNSETAGTRSFLLSRLMAASPTSLELCQERDLLIAKAAEVGAQIDTFLDAVRAENGAALEEQHRAVREQGREQSALCGQLTGEFNAANADWNKARDSRAHAVDTLNAARYQQSHLGRWASDDEIGEAESRVTLAKRRADRAIEKENESIAKRNRAEEALLDARAKLNELATEEIRLRHALDGKTFVDPELGLIV